MLWGIKSMAKQVLISEKTWKHLKTLKGTKPEFKTIGQIIDIAIDRLKEEEPVGRASSEGKQM